MNDADPALRVGVVVVAAGAGTRLGAGVPKAFAQVGGRRILDHAVCGALAVPGVVRVVVVVPAAAVAELAADPGRWEKSAASSPSSAGSGSESGPGPQAERAPRVRVVAGGAERTDSVRAGLAALGGDIDIVLVHDAARCLTPVHVYDRVIAAVAAGHPAVVPGLAAVDTMKLIDADGGVTATPDRARLRAIQTPQGFTHAALARAHASGEQATDDAALAEACGIPVHVVAGDPLAFKVTEPEDLARAERLLRRPTLWVIGGLPGTGKTTVSRLLAAAEEATHVRVDSIEQALRAGTGGDDDDPGPAGYAIAYAVAADQLRLGRSVIADLVNPVPDTRAALRAVAARAGAEIREICLTCSDATEHRRRIETRRADIPGHRLPAWANVTERAFAGWPEAKCIDTAGISPDAVLRAVRTRSD